MKFCLTFLFLILSATASWAEDLRGHFNEAAAYWGIPKAWAMAIAKTESGFQPWALNVAGKSFYFNSKSDAVQAAQAAWKAGKSFDVGLMQINNWWLEKYSLDLETAYDPLANIYLGGFILKAEIDRYGQTAKAIGAYHSPDPVKSRLYANKILAAVNAGDKVPTSAQKPTTRPQVSAVKPVPVLSPMTVIPYDQKPGQMRIKSGQKGYEVTP